MTTVREITAWDATLRLGQLTCRAHEITANLSNALLGLRSSLDPGNPAEVFAALTAVEQAARESRDATAEVISHAVSDHGYF